MHSHIAVKDAVYVKNSSRISFLGHDFHNVETVKQHGVVFYKQKKDLFYERGINRRYSNITCSIHD